MKKAAVLLGVALVFSFSSFSWAEEAATATATSTAEAGSPENATPQKPVSLNFNYKNDMARPVVGGKSQVTTDDGLFKIGTDISFEKLLHWKGAHAVGEVTAAHGRAMTDSVGDYQQTSNIQGAQTLKLYQAYVEQSFLKDRAVWLAGVQDLNFDFDWTDSSYLFRDTTFIMGPELSFSGKSGPSTLPNTGLGSRLRVLPTENSTAQVGIYNAVPGDPNEPKGTHLSLSGRNGYFAIAEADHTHKINGQTGHVGLGVWTYTQQQTDVADTTGTAPSRGAYGFWEQKIYSPIEGKDPGLTGFLRAGAATPQADIVNESAAVGLTYLGPLKFRQEDQVGVGAVFARLSSHGWRQFQTTYGQDPRRMETTLEATYRAKALSWLYIQPDLQWVMNPSMNPGTSNALVGAARFEANL